VLLRLLLLLLPLLPGAGAPLLLRPALQGCWQQTVGAWPWPSPSAAGNPAGRSSSSSSSSSSKHISVPLVEPADAVLHVSGAMSAQS
jgi:hypothetical protein